MKKILLGIMIFETLIMSTFCENLSLEMVSIPNKNFEMSKTEVTQKLYESVMGENPSKFKGENNPVENVSWYDAISFCNKMSEKEGLQPVYTVDGKTDILNYISFKDDKINVEISHKTKKEVISMKFKKFCNKVVITIIGLLSLSVILLKLLCHFSLLTESHFTFVNSIF